ncbi:conserved oligomeric Golgi complex subunit 1-like, partial [Oncorhynchus keta]|uniref:conserved oligomeric Golgi complex subunit 1-like n=1 Tax=Oncorhynchus keta TaxID=8018 RepID=UPI00227AC9D1
TDTLGRPEHNEPHTLGRPEHNETHTLGCPEHNETDTLGCPEHNETDTLGRPEHNEPHTLGRPEHNEPHTLGRPEHNEPHTLGWPEHNEPHTLGRPEHNEPHTLGRPEHNETHTLGCPEHNETDTLGRPELNEPHTLGRPEHNETDTLGRPEHNETHTLGRPEHNEHHTLGCPEHNQTDTLGCPEHNEPDTLGCPEHSEPHTLGCPEHSEPDTLGCPEHSEPHTLGRPEHNETDTLGCPEHSEPDTLGCPEHNEPHTLGCPEHSEPDTLGCPEHNKMSYESKCSHFHIIKLMLMITSEPHTLGCPEHSEPDTLGCPEHSEPHTPGCPEHSEPHTPGCNRGCYHVVFVSPSCKEDICNGVSSLLVYVNSLKGLASIRDAVWDLLSTDSISQHWSFICQRLLERPLALWEDFLQQLFLQRLQAITQEGTETISTSCRQLLSSALRDLEGHPTPPGPGPPGSSPPLPSRGALYEADVASFLWSEAQGDLLSDAAWVSVSQRGPQHRSGLAMKTQALTPCVQIFCSSLDAALRDRLDDLQHYLPSDNTDPQVPSVSFTIGLGSGSSSGSGTVSSFDRFTDAVAVEETLRERCLACVRDIITCVRSKLEAASPVGSSPGPARLSSVLFMARLCQSLSKLCPNLRQCILGKQGCAAADPVTKGTPRQSRKLGKAAAKATEVSPAQAKWACLKEELLVVSMEAYRIWSSALSKALVGRFATSLHAESAGAILANATNWEELEIQEEAESGSSVTSKIRLPVQPSWFVQSLLFHLCLEVNGVGGHAVPRPTLQELLQGCMDLVLHQYQNLIHTEQDKDCLFPMTQNRSLQLLFDLRYLTATLGTKLEDGRGFRSQQDPRVQQVCDSLESYIDPFDLDVFMPPFNSNLNRLSQRSSVLLGLLTGTEKQFVSRGNSAASQEPYNILPLASTQIRFGLLPLSMTNSRKTKSSTQGTDITRPLASPTCKPAHDDTFRPGNLFRQLANQEEEPVAPPSLFKLGWLSGMSK